MLRKIFTTTITAAAIGLVGVLNASADHGQLSGDEIKTVVNGATAKGKSRRGGEIIFQIRDDGSLRLDNLDSGFSDTGKWTVEDDSLCTQWNKINQGKKGCSTVRHLSGDKYLFIRPNRRNSYTITK